jgi:hypothetical protein
LITYFIMGKPAADPTSQYSTTHCNTVRVNALSHGLKPKIYGWLGTVLIQVSPWPIRCVQAILGYWK